MKVPVPDLKALLQGEVIVAFAPRGTVDEGDEVTLEADVQRAPHTLKPAYARWSTLEPDDLGTEWTAVVEGVHPAALLDPIHGAARHILVDVPHGDLVVLRVFGREGPVLGNAAFEARRRSLEGALAT